MKGAVSQDGSEAGWKVYDRVKPRRQKICRNHLVVDTSQDVTVAIDKIVREISR